MTIENIEWRVVGEEERYETEVELDGEETGEDIADTLLQASVTKHPDDWEDFDGSIEIISPAKFAGFYNFDE